MKSKISIVLLFLLAGMQAFAQQSVKGIVRDSADGQPLYNASVVLLEAKDSFMVADMRAGKDGQFVFSNLTDTFGYALLFSYPGYAAYSYKLNIKNAGNPIDLGKINLIPKGQLLKEVIVSSRMTAIKIKGDTTEFLADRFKVQPNASVEDLLKQLPGIQVDQYGNITAQGQKVNKLLVDGEEFFGDDPVLVTRNLRADMVDKVQVYDKKSDAAVFTGIDDGIKNKTINLKIKHDKNNGIFGKADAGAGTDHHYNVQGIINFFKEKRKAAAFVTSSNIGQTGLSGPDKQRIGDNENGADIFSGKGVPTATSGGLHYDNKWNGDKEALNGTYKFTVMDILGKEATTSRNNLPAGTILSESQSNFENHHTNNTGNIKYIHQFDPSSSISVYTTGSIYKGSDHRNSTTYNLRGDSSRLYDNDEAANNDYSRQYYTLDLSWMKKFKKRGRTISLYLDNDFSSETSSGDYISNSTFYNAINDVDSTASLHLNKAVNDHAHVLNFKSIYTEPLSKKWSLIVNYALNNQDARDDKRSYNFAAPSGKAVDTAFSTNMHSGTWENQGGVAFNYSSKKIIFKAGNNINAVQMNLNNTFTQAALKKQYFNWNPSTSLNYTINDNSKLKVNYRGESVNPQRDQLLPFNYNNNQLTTYLPNPDLENSFTHKFSGSYEGTHVSTQAYFGGDADYNLVSEPITPSVTVTPSGAYIYQYVNMSGYTNSSYSLKAYYSQKIKRINWQTGIMLSYSGEKSFSPVNNVVNELKNNTYSVSVEIFKTKPHIYSLYLTGSGGYNRSLSSLQPEGDNNYFFYSLAPTLDIYFLKKCQLHTDVNATWQQKTKTFPDNFSRTIWNAWLGRHFLKDDQLTVKVSCHDILNENNGYSRTATNTFFSENIYTTIRRYFMIGATWNFTKFKVIKQ